MTDAQVEELTSGLMRRIETGVYVAQEHSDANAQWFANHLLGMARFITEWQRRNEPQNIS